MANDNNINKQNDEGVDPTRRKFLKNTGIALGGVAGGSLLGGLLVSQSGNKNDSGVKESESQDDYSEARMFFTRFEDFVVLEQATERIYPEDDNGPGAIGLGVPYFIDKQLAGKWGVNAKDYRQGPFKDSNPTANTSSLTRGDIFIIGLRKMNEVSQKKFNETFNKLEAEQQDEILTDFSNGDVKMKGIDSNHFFDLLLSTTLEGAYSDPMYGGNRNMEGWKMKEYPGSVASYTDMIEEKEFVKMDPISLTNYQQKS
ncbi:MAG TPA: gluconate 2-dehydrogenase subunit 3 family protein [Pseudogracilibacillus sp.]|nr:gluconate 2-dehydrogenase subunit 3 family protein [Pseudogracilibacillus sp.]